MSGLHELRALLISGPCARNTAIEAFYRRLVGAGVRPLSVGGDHSITSSILKAIGANEPVGMIHIDAHCDTAGPYEGTKFQHGGPFRLAVLDGVLDPRRTIQIGIRGPAEYLWEFSYESGMTVVHAEEVSDASLPRLIEKAREVVGDGPTYISFDIDSVDPGFAPGTGTPEVGGLQPREVLQVLRGLDGLNIVGETSSRSHHSMIPPPTRHKLPRRCCTQSFALWSRAVNRT